MIGKALFSSNSDEWNTPQDLYDRLNAEFNFTLDPCTNGENSKCDKFYTVNDNGLNQSWFGESVFCNPPYSNISNWVEKCFREVYGGGCKCAVLLIPARTDTRYFHKYIYHKSEIRFIKGRLKFSNSKNSAPFPSMVVIFRGI